MSQSDLDFGLPEIKAHEPLGARIRRALKRQPGTPSQNRGQLARRVIQPHHYVLPVLDPLAAGLVFVCLSVLLARADRPFLQHTITGSFWSLVLVALELALLAGIHKVFDDGERTPLAQMLRVAGWAVLMLLSGGVFVYVFSVQLDTMLLAFAIFMIFPGPLVSLRDKMKEQLMEAAVLARCAHRIEMADAKTAAADQYFDRAERAQAQANEQLIAATHNVDDIGPKLADAAKVSKNLRKIISEEVATARKAIKADADRRVESTRRRLTEGNTGDAATLERKIMADYQADLDAQVAELNRQVKPVMERNVELEEALRRLGHDPDAIGGAREAVVDQFGAPAVPTMVGH